MTGHIQTLATRKKISLHHARAMLGKHHSESAKEKIGKASKGNTYRLGKHHTVEAKRKISEKCKGRIQTVEEIQRRAKSNTGKKRTEETKKKISIAQLGRKQPQTSGDNNPAKRKDVREKIRNSKLGSLNPVHKPGVKDKIRKTYVEYLIRTGITGREGEHETQILNEIELSLGYKILRQYVIEGYYVDGYVKELNLVIEVDELRHTRCSIVEKDIIRQGKICNSIGCNFFRIYDYLGRIGNESNNAL